MLKCHPEKNCILYVQLNFLSKTHIMMHITITKQSPGGHSCQLKGKSVEETTSSSFRKYKFCVGIYDCLVLATICIFCESISDHYYTVSGFSQHLYSKQHIDILKI